MRLHGATVARALIEPSISEGGAELGWQKAINSGKQIPDE